MCKERYINPFTDFGFKRLFGSEEGKVYLISFLNSILDENEKITDVTFLNTEKLGMSPADRSAFFDLYCETETGAHFIVEMQNVYQRHFLERSIYYSTFPMHEAAQKGDWDFSLPKIYTVAFLNFKMSEFLEDPNYLHVFKLSDTKSGKVLYDKLTYIYIEMPKFQKEAEELETDNDRWLYTIKNMNQMDEYPEFLGDEDIYKGFFGRSEVYAFTKEERFAYEISLKNMRDYNNVLRTAVEDAAAAAAAAAMEKGMEKGREEGIEIGREEGREEGIEIGAKRQREQLIGLLRESGMSEEEIKARLKL